MIESHATATKYIPIDKNIVNQESIFDFNIYYPTDNNTKIVLYQEKLSSVKQNDNLKFDDIKSFYILEDEDAKYQIYYKAYLDSTKEIVQSKNLNFEEKSEAVYVNASMVLDNLFSNPEISANYEASIEVVNNLVDTIIDDNFAIKALMKVATNDYNTHTHSINVAIYSLCLGSVLDLQKDTLSQLGEAALLHDIGKSKIDHAILYKKGTLSDKEFKEMKRHPSLGYVIALKTGIKNLKVLEGIKYHHEKMDGSGYPDGIIKSQIPLFARIIGLCDVFDALTSTRTYKEAMPTFEALKLIKLEMKNHVDPNLLNKMIRMFN